MDFVIANFMTSSARCGQGETRSQANKLANICLFIHVTSEAASNVPASEEDIVSHLLHTVFKVNLY